MIALRRHGAAIGLVLFLGACAAPQAERQAPPTAPMRAPDTLSAPLPSRPAPPIADPSPAAAPSVVPPAAPPRAAIAPAPVVRRPPPPTAEALTGLEPAALAARLGPADLRRRDGRAEVWQYRRGGCVVDVFFLPRPGSAALRSVRLEARNRFADAQPLPVCLGRLATPSDR